MKLIHTILFLSFAFLSPAVIGAETDEAFLWAVRQKETGDNPSRVGSRREKGAYQFRQATWRQHTRAPFALAHDPEVAGEIAKRHLAWLRVALIAEGLPTEPTFWHLAAAWNAGAAAVAQGRIPASAIEHANCVVNLLEARCAAIAEHHREYMASTSAQTAPVAAHSFGDDWIEKCLNEQPLVVALHWPLATP